MTADWTRNASPAPENVADGCSFAALPALRKSRSARGNVIFNRHQAKMLALLLFWLGGGNLNWAQQPASPPQMVSGLVRTSEGTPVPAATVRLVNTETNKAWLSWTDESGKFEFPQIPAGSYRVEASQLGFANSSLVVDIPVAPPGPIPIVLRVATLAELTAKPEATRAPRNPRTANGGANNNAGPGANVGADAGSGRRGGGSGGRGQTPAGVTNAIRAGLAGGGFEQTDLTDAGAGGAAGATNTPANEGTQVAAELPAGAGSSATSDSFLLQGTVGQGLSGNGPGGFGANGLVPGNPTGEGGQGPGGGRGGPGAGGPGGGQGGAGGFGGPSGGGGMFGGAPGGGGGGGMFGGRGRLNRQAVNRIRFSFYDRYENSALDAKPYSITGNALRSPATTTSGLAGNLGGPAENSAIYNGSDKTFFFVNYQHETQSSALDNYSTVPTAAERSGNFCGLGITLYDPFSNFTGPRTPLGNGCQIPAINTAAAGLLAFYPMPNLPGTVQNLCAANHGAGEQRHIEFPHPAHHQCQVQFERRIQPEFPRGRIPLAIF